jgi:hypothetical protein
MCSECDCLDPIKYLIYIYNGQAVRLHPFKAWTVQNICTAISVYIHFLCSSVKCHVHSCGFYTNKKTSQNHHFYGIPRYSNHPQMNSTSYPAATGCTGLKLVWWRFSSWRRHKGAGHPCKNDLQMVDV